MKRTYLGTGLVGGRISRDGASLSTFTFMGVPVGRSAWATTEGMELLRGGNPPFARLPGGLRTLVLLPGILGSS